MKLFILILALAVAYVHGQDTGWQIDRLQRRLQKLEQNLYQMSQNLKKNSAIPIGFVYAQLPSMQSPQNLWPTMIWTEVSSTYAGLFFRVAGGNAAPFGYEQAENCPQVSQVLTASGYQPQAPFGTDAQLTPGQWSEYLEVGTADPNLPQSTTTMSFYVTPGEVRPANAAMKIWRRDG